MLKLADFAQGAESTCQWIKHRMPGTMLLPIWLGGSSENLENFLLMLADKYIPSLNQR